MNPNKAENRNFADGLTPNLEDTTDKSLAGMGVTEVYITHMKMPEDCYYSHISLATQKAEEYRVLDIAVNTIFLEGSIKHITGSALDALIVQRFAKFGAGASPCHAIDNFSRKRGRIIAKGRLLKHLKATKQESHTEASERPVQEPEEYNMKLTKTKRKELKPGDASCAPYKQAVSEVYVVLRDDLIDSLSNAEVLRIEPDNPKKAEPKPETIEIEKAAGIALRDNGIIIAADCRALTARISEAETTASPTAAAALQEARGHLLRASMAVERAHTEQKDAEASERPVQEPEE